MAAGGYRRIVTGLAVARSGCRVACVGTDVLPASCDDVAPHVACTRLESVAFHRALARLEPPDAHMASPYARTSRPSVESDADHLIGQATTPSRNFTAKDAPSPIGEGYD